MRKNARIVTVTFWLMCAASTADVYASRKREAPLADPPPCPAKFDDILEGDGIAHDFRHGVTPPKPTKTPEAELSDTARREFKKQHMKRFDAASVLTMLVGVDGVPRNVCLVKAAGYDLDGNAAEAVGQYRFKPAMKDGIPVPARLTVEVNFRLY